MMSQGRHLVEIRSAKAGTSHDGYPQIELLLGNDEGSIRDTLVIKPHDVSIAKVVALTDSAGLPRPVGDDVSDPSTGRLAQSYLDTLVGRSLTIVCHDLPTPEDPTQKHTEIVAYSSARFATPRAERAP